MEVNISDQGKWERIIDIIVPYDEIVPRFNEAYVKYKKTIQLEGFRKGKVPIDLIKKVFGVKIETEIAENSVSDFLSDAIEKNNLQMYSLTKLESFEYNRHQGLKFKAIIKIKPEVEVSRYKQLEVEREIYQIDDEDVKQVIENVREQHATMTNIDGEAQRGHYIVADVQKMDVTWIPIVGQKLENRYYQLDGDDGNKQFVEQLIGVKAGEMRRVVLSAIDPNAGNSISEYYSVTVKEVKEKKLPDLDDEFAKDLGNYDNLLVLSEAIRRDLEREEEQNSRQNLYRHIIDAVVKNNPIDLPDYIVDDFLNAFVENLSTKVQQDRKENKIDTQEIRERYRTDAIWNLKWRMIRDKISELEDITVNDAEVSEYIEELARTAGKNATIIRNNYRDSKKREQVMAELQERKVLNLLLNHAKITEKKVTSQDRKKFY